MEFQVRRCKLVRNTWSFRSEDAKLVRLLPKKERDCHPKPVAGNDFHNTWQIECDSESKKNVPEYGASMHTKFF